MNQLAECVGCGRDILPICKSETGTRHYGCSKCGASFSITGLDAAVVLFAGVVPE